MNTPATDHSATGHPRQDAPLPNHIVVGVDGTESSLRALDTAATVARRNEAEVTVAFVRHLPSLAAVGAVAPIDQATVFAPLEAEIEEAAKARLSGVRWRLVTADGAPAVELERIAVEAGADLLVVGRSQGGRIHRLIEGSVGGHAATDARVAVLVVR